MLLNIESLESLKKIIGKNVKKYRKTEGITQLKLAQGCGLGLTYISQIEQGLKWPSVKTVTKISSVLKVPPTAILSDSESVQILQEQLAHYMSKLKETDLEILTKIAKVLSSKK